MSAPAPSKYSGPHSRFSSACDGKVDDWWDLDAIEGRDVSANDKWVWDTKWKHSAGFVKYKLMMANPQTNKGAEGPAQYGCQYSDEATLRQTTKGHTMNWECKGENISSVWDMGSHAVGDAGVWVNPFIGFNHNRQLKARSWVGGLVGRWQGLMWRGQLQFSGLCEKVPAGMTWTVAQRGEYVHDAFSFRWNSQYDHAAGSMGWGRMMLGYNAKPWGVWLEGGRLAADAKNPDKVRDHVALSGSYNCSDCGVELAAKVTVPTSNPTDTSKMTGLAGVNWTLDKDMKMMWRADQCGELTMNTSHKWNSNATMFFTFATNIKNWNQGEARKNGYMGLPFNCGAKLKYEA